MILGKVELLVMAILLSKNIAQCDDRARPRGATTAWRDDCAAVGWAWTGRNLILDEALLLAEPFMLAEGDAPCQKLVNVVILQSDNWSDTYM